MPAPFIRITTCGLLTVEIVEEVVSTNPPLARYLSMTLDQLRGRGTRPALSVLKLLLNCHAHFALKDWLLEHYCHEGELFSSARIENVVSLLRKLLCLPAYEDLRTHLVAHVKSGLSGSGYQLALYPLVWVDSEALSWNVEQAARMESFGDDGFPFWERAYELAKRGPYLPDELFSEWATFRREEVKGMLRQSVQSLALLYVARQGAAGEEEALLLLRSFWQEHPHEEDVLRALMEQLGQLERYQEALEYYKRFQKLLQEDGQEPTAQTRDVATYLRTKQVQRPPLAAPSSQAQILSLKDHLAPATNIDAIIATEQHILGENDTQDRSLQRASLVVPEDTFMTSFDGSRRLALQQLLGLASAATSTSLSPLTNTFV
ncbi:MAG: AfsR/SARP family transcriptional regulator, partial [Ktedonobacteraceae bacterium]